MPAAIGRSRAVPVEKLQRSLFEDATRRWLLQPAATTGKQEVHCTINSV